MLHKTKSNFSVLIALSAIVIFFAGCEEASINSQEETKITSFQVLNSNTKSPMNITGQHPQSVNKQLAALRRTTAPFHNFDKAIQADYDTPLTSCWYHNELGAMGYHYGNLSLLDGSVSLLEPEALMYEPGSGGYYRLVGMEYIVPIAAWEGADNPSLLGQEFHRNESLGLYTLHIWLWRNNPAGLFANWNSKVSCEYAEEQEDRAGI